MSIRCENIDILGRWCPRKDVRMSICVVYIDMLEWAVPVIPL